MYIVSGLDWRVFHSTCDFYETLLLENSSFESFLRERVENLLLGCVICCVSVCVGVGLLWDFDYFYRERDKEYRCLSWLHFIHQLEIRFIAFCAWASWSRIRALFLLIYIRQHDRFDLVWRRWQLRLYQRRIARLKQGPKCGSFVFHQLCVGRGWRSCQQSPQHQPS